MRICLLIERPIGHPSTVVISDLARELRQRNCTVSHIFPPADFIDLRNLPVDCDLYVSKACSDALMSLTGILTDRGARIVNSFHASNYVRDKARATSALMKAGVPVPESCIAGNARLAFEGLGGEPIIVKPVRGVWGEGIEIAESEADVERIKGGPHFAQKYDRVTNDDLKVYVIGEEVFTVRRHNTAVTVEEMRGELCVNDREIVAVALRVRKLFGLDVCGIDIVETSNGIAVVDVNSFPGFIGVPDAPRRLADCILACA